MMVESRVSGEITRWRVGRLRLAWRPGRVGSMWEWEPFWSGRNEDRTLVIAWLGALLATVAALPWRLVTGRWRVIAYLTWPNDIAKQQVVSRPMPRAEADELARHWAEYIKLHGTLPLPPETSTRPESEG